MEQRPEKEREQEQEVKEWVKPSADLDHLTAEVFYQSILPSLVKGIV